MKKQILLVALAVSALSGQADVLELKNGKSLNGKYMGGTVSTIRFETSEGVQAIEASQALALTFTGGGAAASTPAAAAAGPTPVAAGSSVTIPAGTPLAVRMVDGVTSKDKTGKQFAATLETDLTVNGALVAPSGTKVYGKVQASQQARRYTGQSTLVLQLTSITVGTAQVPVVTSGHTDVGSRSVGKAARGAAAGAAIGAIADGGDGAGKGAAIGAVASGVKKGESISITPGTLLEFKLQQPVTVNR